MDDTVIAPWLNTPETHLSNQTTTDFKIQFEKEAQSICWSATIAGVSDEL